MKKWIHVVMWLTLCSAAFAQVPPARACKQEVIIVSNGCILCGLTQGSGWCTCHLVQPCTDPPMYGGDVVVFQGNCYPPLYCNGITGDKAKQLAEHNRQLTRNRWLYVDFSKSLPEPELAKALESVQKALLSDDVSACSWAAMRVAMRNETSPTEPWIADFKDMGNGYTLTLSKHTTTPLLDESFKATVDSREVGIKWTLKFGTNNTWLLESSEGTKTSGSF